MPEEILPNLFRIEVPLPGSPLKALNSYVIKGADRNLVIDTGMNREVCRQALLSGLDALKIDLSRTDIFITHVHADHSGLVSHVATGTSQVYFNRPDAAMLTSTDFWDRIVDEAVLNGFPEEEARRAVQEHPGQKYKVSWEFPLHLLADGDTLKIDGYNFECLHTPGHTPGHMCLYEPAKKLLISGDHVLGDITPNITSWSNGDDPLGDYLVSLDRVYALDVDLALPGHRSLIHDCKERIRELKHHHAVRADEVLHILEKGAQNAFQVASQMTWDIQCDSWDSFPLGQKWFAAGEAAAHLRYLERSGKVISARNNGTVTFSAS